MTFPCPYCKKRIALDDEAILSGAGAISNKRRKVHGGGRPLGCWKCPKCLKFHKPEETNKCKA